MYTYRAKVKRVIDGDSVVIDIDLGFDTWIKDQNVRLYGIDTPEVRTKDPLEKKHGKLAKQFVEQVLPEGSDVRITTVKDDDKFGRVLAIIRNSAGMDVAQELLQERLAVPYDGTKSKQEIQIEHRRNREILIIENIIDPDED